MSVNAGDPIKATDQQTQDADTIGRPLIRLVAQSAQSLNDNTATAIQFGASSEDIDTHGYHDTVTNNTRITPTLAGYYRFDGTIMFGSRADYADVDAWIRKNGATNMPAAYRIGLSVTGGTTTKDATVISASCNVIVAMDGVSDYVELVGIQNNVANVAVNLNQSGQYTSVFQGEYLRPL